MQEVTDDELNDEEYMLRTMVLEAELSDEEYMNRIRETARRREARDAADRETQEEKRKLKAQGKMNHRKPSLPPEWKILPGSPENEFKCSQTKKLTAKDIRDMVDNGKLTDEQAEIEFNKLVEKISQKFDNGEITDKQA